MWIEHIALLKQLSSFAPWLSAIAVSNLRMSLPANPIAGQEAFRKGERYFKTKSAKGYNVPKNLNRSLELPGI